MCTSCGKSKAAKIKSAAPKMTNSNSGRRMIYGSQYGTPKVKMSFSSRSR